MSPFRSFLILVFGCILIISCDVQYFYKYQIVNGTDTFISVHVVRGRDSLYMIQKHDTATIFETDRIEGTGGPFFRSINSDFDTITVFWNGLPSKTNFKSNASWNFNKKTSSLGISSSQVTTNDF